MTPAQSEARELTRAECLALLPTAPFGRLAFTDGAVPAILPVNFVLAPDGVVLRTSAGSSVTRADGALVAFQADVIDTARRAGWSVTVVGRATRVRQPIAAHRLSELPLVPWVSGERDTFVAVSLDTVSGRRIGGAEPVHQAVATP